MILGWCDGSCDPNPGPGGWAYLFEHDGQTIEGAGAVVATTNNRMEMQAAIELLKVVPIKSRLLVHSDSMITVNTFRGLWKGKKNLDLIRESRSVTRARGLIVNYKWVKGHARGKHPRQERTDELANEARRNLGIIAVSPFGSCPRCGSAGKVYAIGLDRWGICSRHQVRWFMGDAESLQEIVYERVPDRVLRYREVEPIYPESRGYR